MSANQEYYVITSGNDKYRSTFFALLVVLAAAGGVAGAGDDAPRSRPPEWSEDVRAVFFDDARTVVEGPRPDYRALRQEPPRASTAPETAAAGDDRPSATGRTWSRLVEGPTLETEIKRSAQLVASAVTSPVAFKGGGYKASRDHFSLLAVLFAVVAEHDENVRWQDAAPGLRELFARAGYNAKVGTDQTYQEATARKQDLADLVRGGRPQTPPASRAADWRRVADRPPLMRRMELAHEARLGKWLADSNQFRRHGDEIRHEAQLLAMLAEVVQQKGFEYWDDETFTAYADELREGARDIAIAAEQQNFDQARAALARTTKACSDCHEGYRG